MKNIIITILTLAIGVAEAWGQEIINLTPGIVPVNGTKTTNGMYNISTGTTVIMYIPAGITLTVNGTNAGTGGNGGNGQNGTSGVTNAAGGTGGSSVGKPAICVPTGATLIITGEGTLIAKGGNGGAGGNGGNGENGRAGWLNDYAGAGGAGGGGGSGAAAAIGGEGGIGGTGGAGAIYTEDGSSATYGKPGGYGTSTGLDGASMGNVYIVGNVKVYAQKGTASTTNGANGTFGTTNTKNSWYYHGGHYGFGGFAGSAPNYSIGGGGNGGWGGNGGRGGDVTQTSTERSTDPLQADYTPGTGDNGMLKIQNYPGLNTPDLGESTYDTSPEHYYTITSDNDMPLAIATIFTMDYSDTKYAYYGTKKNIDLATIPTRSGYTFKGYRSTTNVTFGSTSAVLGDTYTILSGTLYYDEEGKFVAVPTDSNGNFLSLFSPSTISLVAEWEANTYTVTFNPKGGSVSPTSKDVTYNATYGDLPTPTRTGYTFNGWFTEETNGTQVTSSTTVQITTDQTLYAHWTAKTYTVNLNIQGGTGGTSSVTVNYESAMPSATAPSRTGYTFKGYYSEQNGGGTQYYAEDMNSAHNWDIDTNPSTLYAKWEANKCTIDLDKQGGSGGTAYVTGTYDSAMPSATAPSRTGYTFAGYYTSPNGGGTQFYDENMVSVSYWNITTNPSTLYANWTANTYTLNFDVQNGDALSPSTQSVTYDAAYGTLPTPTRYGFAFKGWYTTPNGGSETDTEVLPSDIYSIDGDQTIYAHWNTIVVDIDAYSAEEQLTDNYFRTFYDSQIAHILPDGVKAYKGKIEGNYLVLTAIEAKDDDDNDIIPKNVPVILRMMPNEEAGVPIPGDLYQIKTKQISLTTSESELTIDNTDNELIGSDIVIATAVANSYILSFGSNGLGFYEWSTHPLEAHKAYVIKDSTNPAKALTFRFEDDMTGINDAITEFKSDSSQVEIYNLNGIRLSKPQKGINIINGRKFWIK